MQSYVVLGLMDDTGTITQQVVLDQPAAVFEACLLMIAEISRSADRDDPVLGALAYGRGQALLAMAREALAQKKAQAGGPPAGDA